MMCAGTYAVVLTRNLQTSASTIGIHISQTKSFVSIKKPSMMHFPGRVGHKGFISYRRNNNKNTLFKKSWNALVKIGSNDSNWHARRDLNPRPLDSKSTALSTELRAHHDICCDQILPIYFRFFSHLVGKSLDDFK